MKKIAYIVNHLSFFNSHILPLALHATRKGYDVKIFCGSGGSFEMEKIAKKIIKKKKISFERIKGFKPGTINIFDELKCATFLYFKIKKYNPQIIHGIFLNHFRFDFFSLNQGCIILFHLYLLFL